MVRPVPVVLDVDDEDKKKLSGDNELINQTFDDAFKELNQLKEEMKRVNLKPAMRNSSLNLIKTYTEIVAHLRKSLGA